MAQMELARILHPSEVGRAGELLSRAFFRDPMSSYLYPEEEHRGRLLPHLFSAMIRYGCRYGEVLTTDGLNGVAVWLRPGATDSSYWGMVRSGMAQVGLKSGLATIRRVANLLVYAEPMHKADIPGLHWYLFLLGVEPPRQKRGTATSLIQPVLQRSDRSGIPCYLHTLNESNLQFYEKRGFRITRSGTIPGGGPAIWGMLRPPGG